MGRYLDLADQALAKLQRPAGPALRMVPAPLEGDAVGHLATLDPVQHAAHAGPAGKPRCDVCGSTEWRCALVTDDGARACADCATGRTALRRRGIPI